MNTLFTFKAKKWSAHYTRNIPDSLCETTLSHWKEREKQNPQALRYKTKNIEVVNRISERFALFCAAVCV